MGNVICTLTLIPFKSCDWPRPTSEVKIKDILPVAILNTLPSYVDDNLCISYQGKLCKGFVIDLFRDKRLKYKIFSTTLVHNAGTVCMPKEVKTSASSLFAIFNPFAITSTDAQTLTLAAEDGLTVAADQEVDGSFTDGLQLLLDQGVIEQAAFDRLQKEDPEALEAALNKVQAQSPEILDQLAANLPITLAKVNELLKL